MNDAIDLMADTDTHPFTNLLLVSLIIMGFCVFVAWYAKKNQNGSDQHNGSQQDDSGYLWGLNKSTPPDDTRGGTMEMGMGMGKMDGTHRGRLRHKKGLFDEEDLEQRMSVQMTHNDLLAITPDHIGRLQTRSNQIPIPSQMAPSIPPNARNKQKVRTRRRGKGGSFEQLDDDEMDDDGISDSDDSEDGVDMMRMRDEYYASQTFSKKLADTLGDITETVSATAHAVKTKLSKKEQTVVRPMRMGPPVPPQQKRRNKKEEKKQRFAIVQDEELSDQFDLESTSTESTVTAEDEYREDPVTAVRTNANGVRIKQPMALPTFDDDDDDEEEESDSESQR